MKELLLYDSIDEFKKQHYAKLLEPCHLINSEIKIDKVTYEDGGEEDFNFWGWELRKDGIKYLLANRYRDVQVQLNKLLPIVASETQKVAHKGVVYQYIRKPICARFKSVQSKEFKEWVDSLAPFEHSNTPHQKLDLFMALASMMDRVYFRKSTPPGFGKDSIVDLFGGLIGNASTIENPTIAKLEERASVLKWLAVNEVIDISKANWKLIEQILLSMGAYKSNVTKRSRAHGGVGEVIDISDFSLSIMYNDITEYPDPYQYIDFVSKGAVLDRFPAFRLHGRITEDFNKLANIPTKVLVSRHKKDYNELIYNYTYYKDNYMKLLHNYNRDNLNYLSPRWAICINKLLNIIDVYSDNQEEFDYWIEQINESIEDYKEMLKYPKLFDTICEKINKQILDPAGRQ